MKKVHCKKFTLIELMFVIGILVILISLSWVAGRHIFQVQVNYKTKGEIALLAAAVDHYKIRYGDFPATDTSESPHPFSFGEQLSDIRPYSGYTGKRKMYLDYKKKRIKVSNENYDDANANKTKVLDTFENNYLYYNDSANNRFFIWSIGEDGIDSSSDDFYGTGDGDFGDDITTENFLK